VFAWAKRTLQLPKDQEARLESAEPGSHLLTVLPYFSGERTPYWRADLRAAITGHLVFSTLHTLSASATVGRLLDMGVAGYMIATALHGIVAAHRDRGHS